MILETERLVVRNWQESDVEHYLTLATDVGHHCFSAPGRFMVHSTEEARKKVRQRIVLYEQRRLGKFPTLLKVTGEFIGTCGIESFDLEGQPELELGYRLCLKFWGKGYAKEAAEAIPKYGFDDLKLAKIMAFVLPQNRASVRILEQLRFRYLRDFMHGDLEHRLYLGPSSPA